jgi:hypothetical protein
MSDKLKQLVLDNRKEGKLVHTTIEGFVSVDVLEFIKQPADGILYDLNRLEEVALTFIDDPKWVNDFAVALTIRALKAENEALRKTYKKVQDADGPDVTMPAEMSLAMAEMTDLLNRSKP